MERVITPDDRIRRAEEIYARRQSLRERTKRARVNVSEKPKNYRLLKSFVLQIVISVMIYFMFYLVNTTNYSFSENVLNKVRELISTDYDFKGVYNSVVESINNYLYSNENNVQNPGSEINPPQEEGEENKQEQNEGNAENSEQGSGNGETGELSNDDESLTQSEISKTEESETERIKKSYTFSLPVSGTVSSEYGDREVTSSVMTAYHKGIDIGANTGTPIYAATDGEVVIARESPSYGKYIMLQNGEVRTVYAHCNELLVEVRRQSVKRTRNCKSRFYTERLQVRIYILKLG